jgi:GntR family transcriptional regulator, transcriptional repressor for pyruvate dehydrogenase complex
VTPAGTDGVQALERVVRGTGGSPTARLGDQVAQQLLRVLGSGAFAEGAKLPPERELSELLGVSRTVLREALAALQLGGLLVRRQGVGTVIARLPAGPERRRWSKHLEAGASIAELIDARMAVELGCIHLICDKADRDLSEVSALLDVMRIEALSRRSIEGYLPPSLEFHNALARASEAPVLAAVSADLTDRMRAHLWLLHERYTLETVERSLAVHEAMVATLQAGDLISALAATKRHYVEYPSIATGAAEVLS